MKPKQLEEAKNKIFSYLSSSAAIQAFMFEILGEKPSTKWSCCCPFHHSHTDDLHYNPKTGLWKCFGKCNTCYGDCILIAAIYMNSLSKEEWDRLNKKQRGKIYEDTVIKLLDWIGGQKVDLSQIKDTKLVFNTMTDEEKRASEEFFTEAVPMTVNYREKFAKFCGWFLKKKADQVMLKDVWQIFNRTNRKSTWDRFSEEAIKDFSIIDPVNAEWQEKVYERSLKVLKLSKEKYPDRKSVVEKINSYIKKIEEELSNAKTEEERVPIRERKEKYSLIRWYLSLEEGPKYLQNFHLYLIFDDTNHLVSFQGRLTKEAEEKGEVKNKAYNLPNFQKQNYLYGLNVVLKKNSENPQCIAKEHRLEEISLHEGPADAIKAHEFGYSYATSLLGLNISSVQIELIKKYLKEDGRVVIFLDNDEAGIKASKEIAEELKKNGITCYIARTSVNKDVGSATKEEFWESINKAEKQ